MIAEMIITYLLFIIIVLVLVYYIYRRNEAIEVFIDYQGELTIPTIAKSLGLGDKNILRMLYANNMASKCISKEILLNKDHSQSISDQILNQLRNLLCSTNIVSSNNPQPLSGVDLAIPIVIIGIINGSTISDIASMGSNALIKVKQYSDVNQAFGYSQTTINECNMILNALSTSDMTEIINYNGTILITYIAMKSYITNKNNYKSYDEIFNTIISSIFTTILSLCGITTLVDIMDDVLLNSNENSEAYMITDPDYIKDGSFQTLFNLNSEAVINKVIQLSRYSDNAKGILILLIYKLYNILLQEPYIVTENLVNNEMILNTQIDITSIHAILNASSSLSDASKTTIKDIANISNINTIIKQNSSNIIINNDIDLFNIYKICYSLAGYLIDPVTLDLACRMIMMGFNKTLILNNIYESNKQNGGDAKLSIILNINSENYFCSSILGAFTTIVPYVGINVDMKTIKPIISQAKTIDDMMKNVMTELINLNLLFIEVIYSMFLLILCIYDNTNSDFIKTKLNELCSHYYSQNDYTIYVNNIGIILDAINNGKPPIYTSFKDRYEYKLIIAIVPILLEKRIHIAISCGNQVLVNNGKIDESIAISSGVAAAASIYDYLNKNSSVIAKFIIKYENLIPIANREGGALIAPFILNDAIRKLFNA
jgi:hypothetical protein